MIEVEVIYQSIKPQVFYLPHERILESRRWKNCPGSIGRVIHTGLSHCLEIDPDTVINYLKITPEQHDRFLSRFNLAIRPSQKKSTLDLLIYSKTRLSVNWLSVYRPELHLSFQTVIEKIYDCKAVV